MKNICYVNNRFTTLDKPQIKLNDLGFLRGYAVFDFIKVINGKALFWPEHLARFKQSATRLSLVIPKTDKEIAMVVDRLLIKNKIKNGSIRLILSGGITNDGMSPNGQKVFGVLAEDSYNLPSKVFSAGGKLITADYQRIFPEAKTTNYLLAVRLQERKKKAGAIEILYINNGKVLEASTSNFFLIKGKKIITARANVLGGITRDKVIGLAKKAGYKVEERDIKVSEIKTADEAFITATNKEVCPIVKIDEQTIDRGKVGEATKDLLNRYRELAKKN